MEKLAWSRRYGEFRKTLFVYISSLNSSMPGCFGYLQTQLLSCDLLCPKWLPFWSSMLLSVASFCLMCSSSSSEVVVEVCNLRIFAFLGLAVISCVLLDIGDKAKIRNIFSYEKRFKGVYFVDKRDGWSYLRCQVKLFLRIARRRQSEPSAIQSTENISFTQFLSWFLLFSVARSFQF